MKITSPLFTLVASKKPKGETEMNIKLLMRVIALPVLLLSSNAFSISGGTWFPTNGPGQITFVRYDITTPVGEVRVELKDASGALTAYIYNFDANNSVTLSRANAFYSAFLAAQASGKGILVYKMNSNQQINAIQVGD